MIPHLDPILQMATLWLLAVFVARFRGDLNWIVLLYFGFAFLMLMTMLIAYAIVLQQTFIWPRMLR